MAKIKRPTDKQLSKKLDDLVRDCLHKKYPNPECFVCGKKIGWFHPKNNPYGCQVGHYVTRSVLVLRWDEMNLFCQCAPCNRTHEDNQLPFTMAILRKLGQERLDYLDQKYREYKKTGKSLRRSDKLELIDKFTSLLF